LRLTIQIITYHMLQCFETNACWQQFLFMMHNSIRGWQRQRRAEPGGTVSLVGGPFFHFLPSTLTTGLRYWEERCFAFSRNRISAEKRALSRRCLQNINNGWGWVIIITCMWNLLLTGWGKRDGPPTGEQRLGRHGGLQAGALLPHTVLHLRLNPTDLKKMWN